MNPKASKLVVWDPSAKTRNDPEYGKHYPHLYEVRKESVSKYGGFIELGSRLFSSNNKSECEKYIEGYQT